MLCEACQTECKKFGRTREGYQRHRCRTCRKTYSERPERPLGDLRLPLDRALLCLHLLCEGSSVRAVERITGTEKKAVLRLLVQVGEGCERLLAETVKAVPVKDVQADELWTYIRCKQGTRERRKITDPDAGDAYCYFGIERNSKLVLAWHLGRRNTWAPHDPRDGRRDRPQAVESGGPPPGGGKNWRNKVRSQIQMEHSPKDARASLPHFQVMWPNGQSRKENI